MSRLGRGLDSLIKDIEKPADGTSSNVLIEHIKPNRYQPRRHFDADKLAELADSIKENGLIQPIVVCKNGENDYELIAGERRYQACKLAGITSVPVFVKNVTDKERLVLAIIENVQRENLSPIEESKAYKRLVEEFELTHADISKIMSKDRATITNSLRLLKLPEHIQELLESKKLSPGHGRAILSVREDLMEAFTNEILQKGYSTRRTEEEAQNYNAFIDRKKPNSKKLLDKDFLRDIEKNLVKKLKSNVKVKEKKYGAGEITISFADKEELDKLASLFNKIIE